MSHSHLPTRFNAVACAPAASLAEARRGIDDRIHDAAERATLFPLIRFLAPLVITGDELDEGST
jgi:hypothetical protein